MKIAITSDGNTLADQVDPRFGRARNLIVFDTDTGQASAHNNEQNLNAVQGAGIQAARNVAQLGVQVVLTGNVGPKAFQALSASGIQIFTGVSGTVSEAIEKYKTGSLQATSRPNVEGHWV